MLKLLNLFICLIKQQTFPFICFVISGGFFACPDQSFGPVAICNEDVLDLAWIVDDLEDVVDE